MRLGQFGEQALLDWIRRRAGLKNKKSEKSGSPSRAPGGGKKNSFSLLLGIGDDAAVFRMGGRQKALATSDMMLEGVHFDLRYQTPYQLGFKLVSVNVSDIHAMGGRPRLAFFELGAPSETRVGAVKQLFEGVFDALEVYGAQLAGGDVCASRSGLVLNMSVIGQAQKAVTRGGARVGDRLYVTGPLGDSACGLALLKKIGRPVPIGKRPFSFSGRPVAAKNGPLPWEVMRPLLERHLMPLAKTPPENATAMMDISDGLLMDTIRLCKESAVGVKIYEAGIPVSPQAIQAARGLGLDALELARTGGEDYELLYTAPAGKNNKPGGILIGEIIESGYYMVSPDGAAEGASKVKKKRKKFSSGGYEHFSGG